LGRRRHGLCAYGFGGHAVSSVAVARSSYRGWSVSVKPVFGLLIGLAPGLVACAVRTLRRVGAVSEAARRRPGVRPPAAALKT
jgi:hypothetical protein